MAADSTILVFIIEIIANSLILWSLTHLLKFKKQGFHFAFLVTAISFGVFLIEHYLPYTNLPFAITISSFILSLGFWFTPISLLIDFLTIKLIYREGWKKSLATAIFVWLIGAIAGYIFVLIVSYFGYNILTYIP